VDKTIRCPLCDAELKGKEAAYMLCTKCRKQPSEKKVEASPRKEGNKNDANKQTK